MLATRPPRRSTVAWYQGQVPPLAALGIVFLAVVSVVLFILFMRQLARYLGHADYAADVLRLLWKTLALAGGIAVIAQFSAMLGSETFLLIRIVGLAGWAFVLFQFTLLAQQLASAARHGAPGDNPAAATAAVAALPADLGAIEPAALPALANLDAVDVEVSDVADVEVIEVAEVEVIEVAEVEVIDLDVADVEIVDGDVIDGDTPHDAGPG